MPDSSLAFLRDGYLFGTRRFRKLGSDAFRTRILGRTVTVVRGADAARIFYEGDRFGRERSMPTSVVHLLQDDGSVQSLKGEAHRTRKHLFMQLLADAGQLSRLRTLFAAQWHRALDSWPQRIVLYDELIPVFTKTALEWVGIDPDSVDVTARGRQLAAMIDNAGRFGQMNWAARSARRRAEAWAHDLIVEIRAGRSTVADDSPLGQLAAFRDEHGAQPSSQEAAVELLNLLRPIVAIGRFSVFCALALHQHPRWRETFASGRDATSAAIENFVNEVRRFYPFFPVIGGTVLRPFNWHARSFAVGDWVLLDLYGTNHDERIWADPNRFVPSRFDNWDGDPNTLIPQGGGDANTGHRCPGEKATIELLKETVVLLARQTRYDVPRQDLRVSLRRFPAAPVSGFVMENAVSEPDNRGAAPDNRGDDDVTPEPKPQTPPQIAKPTWKYIFHSSTQEFGKDQCTDLAAGLTYHAVLSLFPGLLALVALLGIFGQAQSTSKAILDVVRNVAPGEVTDLLSGLIEAVVKSPSAGFALVIGIVVALWSASGYVRSFSRSMNRIYEVEEGRPFFRLLPVMLLMTLVVLIIAGIMGLILASTESVLRAIGNVVGLGDATIAVWNVAKWPILVILAIIIIALLYYVTPNVKQPKFRWISLGALLALVIMAIASLGFAFYVANFSSYNKTYGTIGAIIVLLLWIWIINLALLFGAEFDSEVERGRELQAGLPAEETLQLPVRDSSGAKKKHDKQQKIIADGRLLREQDAVASDHKSPAFARAEDPARSSKKK